MEKLALAAPARIGLDQGDQLETIQQLEARIRELEAAASGNADTAPGLDSELATLRERVSEQVGQAAAFASSMFITVANCIAPLWSNRSQKSLT